MASTSHSTPPISEPILTLQDGIVLRRYHEVDIPDAVKYLNEPEVRTYLRNRIPNPYTESDARWWVNHCADETHWIPTGPFEPNPQEGTVVKLPGNYAILKDNKLIGSIGMDMKDDVYSRTGEIGYWLARPHWGKGIMGIVVPAYVQWAFATFGILHRIEAEVFAGNGASGAILKKAGMKYEGTHEGKIWKNGQILDQDCWGIVRTEKGDA